MDTVRQPLINVMDAVRQVGVPMPTSLIVNHLKMYLVKG